MPELHSPLAPHYAVGHHPPGTEPGVRFREITGWDLVQAACWRGRAEALHAAVQGALGLAPPEGPSQARGEDGLEILSVAPNRLWCIAAAGDARLERLAGELPRETGCTTQLGHSHVRLRLSGPAARHLLTQEIAVDLAPKAFPAGRIARTSLHHVPVLLHCLEPGGDGLFDLFLPHTFAASTWAYLLDLAEGSGYAIEPTAAHGHEGA